MKIKDQAIKELESLGPSELVTIYEMITSFFKGKARCAKGEDRRTCLSEGEKGLVRV